MIPIDLITGFLGSGKTTFIRKYVEHLLAEGGHPCVLENDYGAINVDTLLLRETFGDRCGVEMVVGGGDPDCHRRRFRTKLIELAMLGYDRVIVEPSGVFDTDEFFDLLYEDPFDRWYEAGSVVSIVDAELPDALSDASEYLLASCPTRRNIFSHRRRRERASLYRARYSCARLTQSITCSAI